MSPSRSTLARIAGVLAGLVAGILLVFAGLLTVLGEPLRSSLVLGLAASFPALLAVACLVPSQRTLAIRLVGAIVCLACGAALVVSLVNPPGGGKTKIRRGMLVTIAVAGGVMAAKGRWPDQDSDADPQASEGSEG